MTQKINGIVHSNAQSRMQLHNAWAQNKPAETTKRRKLKLLKCLFNFLLDYCNQSSLHGLKYVVEPGTHWMKRFTWAFLFTLSVVATVIVIIKLSARFQAAQTSTVIETTNYPVSEIPFPSVTLCPSNRVDWKKALEMEKEIFPTHDEEAVQTYRTLLTTLSTITFGDFDDLAFLKNHSLEAFNDMNLTNLLRNVAPTCRDLLWDCWWRDSYRDCCEIFEPQRTEFGLCYSFNSETADYDRAVYSKEIRPRRTSSSGDWSGLRFNVKLNQSNQPPESTSARFTLFVSPLASSKSKLDRNLVCYIIDQRPEGCLGRFSNTEKVTRFLRKNPALENPLSRGSKSGPLYFDTHATKGPAKLDVLRRGPVMISVRALGVTTFVGHPRSWSNSGRNTGIGMLASIAVQCPSTYATDGVLKLDKSKLPCQPDHRKSYNRDYCLTVCRRSYIIELCGCNPSFMMPKGAGRDCTVEDLVCLADENGFFNKYILKGNPFFPDGDSGMNCSCPPECELHNYKSQITQTALRPSIATDTIFIDVHYEATTMIRYRMDVVHTQLDLLGVTHLYICDLVQVSFGGVVGLFLGGSILSLVELLYYLAIGFIDQVFRRSKTVPEPAEDLEYVKSSKELKPPIPTVYRVLPLMDYHPNPRMIFHRY